MEIYQVAADKKREALAKAVVDSVIKQLNEIDNFFLTQDPQVFLKIYFPKKNCEDCKKELKGYTVVHKYRFGKNDKQLDEETLTKCKKCSA